MIHPKDLKSSNPRLKCVVCGEWKRLHGVDEEGKAIQRFYGGCSFSNLLGIYGEHLAKKENDTDVCDKCCGKACGEIYKLKSKVCSFSPQ